MAIATRAGSSWPPTARARGRWRACCARRRATSRPSSCTPRRRAAEKLQAFTRAPPTAGSSSNTWLVSCCWAATTYCSTSQRSVWGRRRGEQLLGHGTGRCAGRRWSLWPVVSRSTRATARACSPSAATTSPAPRRDGHRRGPPRGARAPTRGCAAGRRPTRGRSPCGSAGPPRAPWGPRVGEGQLDECRRRCATAARRRRQQGDRRADAVADGVGVAVGHVGRRDPVVVAHAGDRALV